MLQHTKIQIGCVDNGTAGPCLQLHVAGGPGQASSQRFLTRPYACARAAAVADALDPPDAKAVATALATDEAWPDAAALAIAWAAALESPCKPERRRLNVDSGVETMVSSAGPVQARHQLTS